LIYPRLSKRRIQRLRRPIRTLSALLKALLLVGCNLTGIRDAIPTMAPPTATPQAADGWELVAPGVERRWMQPDGLGPFAAVVVHRFDPAQVAFRAHISPNTPLYNTQWRERYPDAIAFINANFFDFSNNALGMVVSDATVYGSSYVNRGGMFAVQSGIPRVQPLISQPYDGAALEQAVQGFPMLIADRTPNYQRGPGDRVSRRTVVAQDSEGRILWLSTTLLGMTLDQTAEFLSEADLDIVHALNLDGGGSMLLDMPGASLPSLDPVPVILAVYPK
jgi:exopolysaccharide biosynthesis protein